MGFVPGKLNNTGNQIDFTLPVLHPGRHEEDPGQGGGDRDL